MKIIIKETSKAETLSLIDPTSGADYIGDFIGNTGALSDGQFNKDKDDDFFVCDQETFDWWSKIVTDSQALHNRINNLVQKHSLETVYKVVHAAATVDLEYRADSINQYLDDFFGSAE